MIRVISATISLSDISTGREIDVRLNCHTPSFLPLILLTPDLIMSLVQVIVSTALSIYFRFYTGSASEDPEAMLVGDVVDGVVPRLVPPAVAAPHPELVPHLQHSHGQLLPPHQAPHLVLGAVHVLVSVLVVTELVLGVVLAGHGGRTRRSYGLPDSWWRRDWKDLLHHS